MPDIFGYIKKKKKKKNRTNKRHKMELYGLDCGFSGLMYNFFVLPKKCKFSEEKKKNHLYFTLQLPTDTH